MYSKGKALSHSTYIRPDRKTVFREAQRIAEQEGGSLSRFITDIVYDYLVGDITIHRTRKRRNRR